MVLKMLPVMELMNDHWMDLNLEIVKGNLMDAVMVHLKESHCVCMWETK